MNSEATFTACDMLVAKWSQLVADRAWQSFGLGHFRYGRGFGGPVFVLFLDEAGAGNATTIRVSRIKVSIDGNFETLSGRFDAVGASGAAERGRIAIRRHETMLLSSLELFEKLFILFALPRLGLGDLFGDLVNILPTDGIATPNFRTTSAKSHNRLIVLVFGWRLSDTIFVEQPLHRIRSSTPLSGGSCRAK